MYPCLVDLGFQCQMSTTSDFNASFLNYLLALDEHLNPTLYFANTRFLLLKLALAVGSEEVFEVEGLQGPRYAFLKTIIKRAKPRHYGGEMKKTQWQEKWCHMVWSGACRLGGLTSKQWQ